MIKNIEYDEALELAEDDEFKEVLLYADFEEKEVRTNCADSYYNYSIPMDKFLKFADRIREKLKEALEGKK